MKINNFPQALENMKIDLNLMKKDGRGWSDEAASYEKSLDVALENLKDGLREDPTGNLYPRAFDFKESIAYEDYDGLEDIGWNLLKENKFIMPAYKCLYRITAETDTGEMAVLVIYVGTYSFDEITKEQGEFHDDVETIFDVWIAKRHSGIDLAFSHFSFTDGARPSIYWPENPTGRLQYEDKLPNNIMGKIIAYTSLLMTNGAVVSSPNPRKFANRKRAKKGLLPLIEHHTVTINPDVLSIRSNSTGEGIEKSAHFRRGHFRTIHRGTDKERVIPVRSSTINPHKELKVISNYKVG